MFISVWTNGKYLWPNASIRRLYIVQRLCLTGSKLNVFVMRLGKIKQDMQVISNY